MKTRHTVFAMAAIGLIGATASGEDPKNLLFFGNSFTAAAGGVHRIVQNIAVSAGHPVPYVYGQAIGGVTLQYHLTNSTGVITSGIAPGGHWDNVILQEYSTVPTFHPTFGNVPSFLSAANGLYQAVLNHSPAAKAVMFETWARGPGHSYYPTQWPTPAAMQSELRINYHTCVDNLNTLHGAGSAAYAPVGDAFEAGNFDLGLYSGDIYHESNRVALLVSLVLYGRVYADTTTSDINLSAVAATLGLGAADISFTTALADQVLVPAPSALALLVMGGLLACQRRR